MRILVLGGDGYLGWPTSLHLSDLGHDVAIGDNFVRRQYDHELGVESLVPIETLRTRAQVWQEYSGQEIEVFVVDLTQGDATYTMIRQFQPDTIIHFAEQRAAPYSMIDRQHAVYTQFNNVVGTLNLLYAIQEIDPSIHLVKLGTMGEYGTPNIDIEEGWLEVTHKGRSERVLYPKRPGSYYHLSKVHDSHNIEFACRVWGLRATDLNQGIVYGQQTAQTVLDTRLATRFDYDAVFGTVLNRFVIQAVLREPLTIYGSGSQTRGIIDIRDTVECVRLSVENPAEPGEYRVFNQMTEAVTVADLAKVVATTCPVDVDIEFIDNPRIEAEGHYYNVVHRRLVELGLQPHELSQTLIESMFLIVERHQDRVDRAALRPFVNWRRASNPVQPPSSLLLGTSPGLT
jgi:UDP-sulfoquinovose synthase